MQVLKGKGGGMREDGVETDLLKHYNWKDLFFPGNPLKLNTFQYMIFRLWQATKHQKLLHSNGCEKVQT